MAEGPWTRFQAAQSTGPWTRFQAAPATPEPTVGQSAIGIAEAAGTLASGIVAEPLAGLAGIGAAIIPGGRTGAEAVEATRNALTYEPNTAEGRQNLIGLANKLKPISDILQSAEKASGDTGFDLAGPIGGAIGAALPTALAEMLGLKGMRSAKRVASTEIPADARQIIEAGNRTGTPVLTTDVINPTTFIGKFAQGLSEKLGPLGTGTARASQQAKRETIVQGLADEFDIDLDTDFATRIVNSVNDKSAQVLKDAGEQRKRAVDSLVRFGEVPLTGTMAAIDSQIARQARLGEKADTALVSNLEKIRNSLAGGDFSLVKDIRTEVISDLRAISRGEDTRSAGSLQQVKSAIDQDMMRFARTHDRDASRDWLRSNRAFAHELSNAKDTELRNIFNRGDATPEVVMPILRGGKLSELRRLKATLTPAGMASARAAIIQDALKDSGFFTGDINPDRFTTAMNRPNRQQAIETFFGDENDRQLQGLVRLLDATRRAQQASAAPATGIQGLPFMAAGGLGYGLSANPFGTLAAAGTMSAFAKAYESRPMRNLLLKIANSSPGSKVETGLLEATVPALIAAQQAARAQSEQTELEAQ